jgi:hypothetical protein
MSSVLLDVGGEGLDLIRELDLAVGVWRASTIEELHGLARDTVVLLAVKTEDDIHRHTALLRAYPTVVIGMGLGPRSWSLAKLLGASGYVHDAAGFSAIRGELEQQLHTASQRPSRIN